MVACFCLEESRGFGLGTAPSKSCFVSLQGLMYGVLGTAASPRQPQSCHEAFAQDREAKPCQKSSRTPGDEQPLKSQNSLGLGCWSSRLAALKSETPSTTGTPEYLKRLAAQPSLMRPPRLRKLRRSPTTPCRRQPFIQNRLQGLILQKMSEVESYLN